MMHAALFPTNVLNGIRLKSNNDRGGGEEDIMFSNLTMSGVNYTFYIDCYYDQDYTSITPSIKAIKWKNIRATADTNKKQKKPFIEGRHRAHVMSITLDNVK